MNGMEMAIASVLKMLGIDKTFVEGQLRTLVQTVVEFKAQMDRMEAQQVEILRLLSAKSETENGIGKTRLIGNGSAGRSDSRSAGGNGADLGGIGLTDDAA